MIWAAIAGGVWVIAVVLILSFCRAAAIADRNVPSPSTPEPEAGDR